MTDVSQMTPTQVEAPVAPDLLATLRVAPTPLLLLAADAPRYTMVLVNDFHARAFGTTVAGLEGLGVFEVFPPDPDPASRAFMDNIRRSLDRVLEAGVEDQMPVMPYAVLGPDGAPEERHWSAVNAPVRDAAGRITHIISSVRDLTAEVNARRNEEARALLMREVDHRARNALTVVQSMLRLTEAAEVGEFKSVLGGRIDALARAQTSLARRRWEGADLAGMVKQEMAALAIDGRLRISGARVLLRAEQVQAMSMILHELATNASKYGALGAAEGRVEVAWTIDESDRLRFVWTERGGGPVTSPQRQGFGSRLILRLAHQLRGHVRHHWDPDGLRVELDFPI